MSEHAFDPNAHLMKVKGGADYLEVKWRLVWFRSEHPDGIIETELIRCDEKSALFKATVEIPLIGGEGGGRSSGYGSETVGDFKDFIEKAETKAIGRALAALGYGTQFAPDLDDGASKDRPVDSPVQRQDAPPRNRSTTRNTAPDLSGSPQTHEPGAQASEHPVNVQRASAGQPRPSSNAAADDRPGLLPATPRQREFLDALAQEMGITPSALETEVKSGFGVALADINRRDASVLIERLNQRRNRPS